ncbi:MAG: OmpA family protein [Bacteroidales bacterium]
MKHIYTFLILLSSLYAFSQDLEPTDDMALITVKVENFEGMASVGDKVAFKSKSTGKKYTGVSKSDGTFQILLPEGDSYTVLVMGFEMDNTNNVFKVPDNPGKTRGTYTITYELPKTYTLNNLYFDSGKATIRKDSYETLNNLAELMKRKKTMVIQLSGHTDNVGSKEANQKLSEARAESVKQYLVSKGVQAMRVVAVGFGQSKPIASNNTPQGRQENRRTEVKILHE